MENECTPDLREGVASAREVLRVGNSETDRGSVGRVKTHRVDIDLPSDGLPLSRDAPLSELSVAYECYGERTPAGDNVIFICHALTGDAHAAGISDDACGTVGWWDQMIGPGKGIDTRYYQVICANILGGCKGTTGPSSTNPATGRPYGSDFPPITISDIVDVHCRLLRKLGIDHLAAVIGGSLGGMQVLDWAVRYPDMMDRCICIASAAGLPAQALAFDIVGRKAITSDPDWQNGHYYGTGRTPARGLAQARKIGHITYLSSEMMTRKFGRERRETEPLTGAADDATPAAAFQSDFQVESYLDYQGKKFLRRFDANSYLYITHAMDEYDLAAAHPDLESALQRVHAKMLIVALSSDWLFPPSRSLELANALIRCRKQVSYCTLHAPHGHDAFLVDIEHLSDVVRAFLPWVSPTGGGPSRPPVDTAARQRGMGLSDYIDREAAREPVSRLMRMIQPGSRVLDLGCGKGGLLALLHEQRAVSGLGADIDINHVIDAIDHGYDILQADIDDGLAVIPDGAYDYAILNETLQVVRRPQFVLREMLRVAREGIVTFPNFAKWRSRLQLGLRGHMPKDRTLPFEWYDTPNIHLFTLSDFFELCKKDHIQVLDTACLSEGVLGSLLIRMHLCNIGADTVIVHICRDDRRSAPARRGSIPCS